MISGSRRPSLRFLRLSPLTSLTPPSPRTPPPRLCVAALALDSFCGIREALYGVFDGDKNVEVPNLLQCTMGDVLAEELQRPQRQEDYMTNTFLTMQRKLGTAGQRMGGAAALCHIRHDPVAPSEHGGCFTLKAANVGGCQAVLCRDGRPVPLSSTHTVKDEEEYLRVRRHNAIVTEVTAAAGRPVADSLSDESTNRRNVKCF